MKLTPHEKKILALIEKNPEIITDTKKRAVIAEENGLSENCPSGIEKYPNIQNSKTITPNGPISGREVIVEYHLF